MNITTLLDANLNTKPHVKLASFSDLSKNVQCQNRALQHSASALLLLFFYKH